MARGVKTGGRRLGTSNAITTKTKEAISQLIEGSLDGLKDDLKELSPKDRLSVITNLLKYVIPTLKASEVVLDSTDGVPSWVNEILNEKV